MVIGESERAAAHSWDGEVGQRVREPGRRLADRRAVIVRRGDQRAQELLSQESGR